MTIIEAVTHMKNGGYVTHPKWKNGSFYDYYLVYNNFYDCIDLVDSEKIEGSDYGEVVGSYGINLESILDNKWIIYKN